MKKSYYYLCSLTLAFASTGLAEAQTFATLPSSPTPAGELTDGTYVIKLHTLGTTGYLYHGLDESDSYRFRLRSESKAENGVSADGKITAFNYLWKLVLSEDGKTFTLQCADTAYLPADARENSHFTGSETANLAYETNGDITLDGGVLLYQTNYSSGTENMYLYVNADDGQGRDLVMNYHPSKDVSEYGDAVAVSFYRMDNYDITDVISAASFPQKTTGYVGDYTETYIAKASDVHLALNDYRDVPSRENLAAITSAISGASGVSPQRILLSEDKYYQIKSLADNSKPYFSSSDVTVSQDNYFDVSKIRTEAEASVVPQLWRFSKVAGNSAYFLSNANSGTNVVLNGSTALLRGSAGKPEEAYGIRVEQGPQGVTSWNLTNAKYGSLGTDGEVVTTGAMAADATSNWNIIPVESFTVKIPATTKWISGNYPFGVRLPETLTAYIVDGASETATTTKSVGQEVPANTPVIITLSDGTAQDGDAAYTLTIDDSIAQLDTDRKAANLLEGTMLSRRDYAENSCYVLSLSKGMFVSNGDLTTLPANKAYLPMSKISGNNYMQTLSIGTGETTGIGQSGVFQTQQPDSDVYYDLNGRRVLYPSHGIFVKANGEKVYIK